MQSSVSRAAPSSPRMRFGGMDRRLGLWVLRSWGRLRNLRLPSSTSRRLRPALELQMRLGFGLARSRPVNKVPHRPPSARDPRPRRLASAWAGRSIRRLWKDMTSVGDMVYGAKARGCYSQVCKEPKEEGGCRHEMDGCCAGGEEGKEMSPREDSSRDGCSRTYIC